MRYDQTKTPAQNVAVSLAGPNDEQAATRANVTVGQVDALIADRARYRAVARELVRWNDLQGIERTTGMQTLLDHARSALNEPETTL